jgi:hypothetical protein
LEKNQWINYQNMYRIFILSFISIFLFFSCEENNSGPSESGDITISSEFFGTTVYYVNGYSFEEEKYVPTINPGGSVADIIPENVLLISGDVVGMIFSADVDGSGFYKNFESSNLTEAEDYFNNYLQVETDGLSSLSDTLKAGQVYTFLTYKDNYVKILIEEVRKMSGSLLSDYFEADIKYYIQRDGSAEFDE